MVTQSVAHPFYVQEVVGSNPSILSDVMSISLTFSKRLGNTVAKMDKLKNDYNWINFFSPVKLFYVNWIYLLSAMKYWCKLNQRF